MAVNYNFEWDPKKARINLQTHRVGFEETATVFNDSQAVTIFDPDHSQQEDRWITLGISAKGRLLVVIHTFKEETIDSIRIRIISSRKATKIEKKKYGEQL